MTALLEKALGQAEQGAERLSLEKQDQLASVILEAMDALEWDRQFEGSLDVLQSLERDGLADAEAGRTHRLGA